MNKRKKQKSYRPKSLTILMLLLIVFGLSLSILFAVHQSPSIEQHAAVSQSQYPANIQLDGSQWDYPYGQYNPKALANPMISGVVARLDWSDVEPSQDNFNWGPFDQEVQAWIGASKKFAIVVRYANEPAANKGVTCNGTTHNGQYLPDWEIAKIPTHCTASGVVIPDYFNATFQSDIVAFINAVTAHIQSKGYQDSIIYGRFAMGEGGEDYSCLGCDGNDLNVLNQWGYSISAWRDWQEQMFLKYQKAFSIAPVIYGMGGNIVDPSTGKQVYEEVASFALKNGGGIGQEGLNPKDKYANGNIVTFMKQAHQQYPNAYMELATVQMLQDAVTPGCDIHCVAEKDIQTANNATAFTIEWYPTDAGDNAGILNDVFHTWQAMVDLRTGSLTPTQTPMPTELVTPTISIIPTVTCMPMPPQCRSGSRLGIACPIMPKGGWCPVATPTQPTGCYYVQLHNCPVPPDQMPPHYCQRLICPSGTPQSTVTLHVNQ